MCEALIIHFYFLLFLACFLACWKKEPNGLPPAEEKKLPKSSSSLKAENPLPTEITTRS